MADDAIEVARRIAERAHHGQVDKVGAPYIAHPAMVADLLQRLPGFRVVDPLTQQDVVVAAWLHDVVEDSPLTAENLLAIGVSERAVETKAVAPDDYYVNLKRKPVALLVKTADLAANLHPDRVARLDTPCRSRNARPQAVRCPKVPKSARARLTSASPA